MSCHTLAVKCHDGRSRLGTATVRSDPTLQPRTGDAGSVGEVRDTQTDMLWPRPEAQVAFKDLMIH